MISGVAFISLSSRLKAQDPTGPAALEDSDQTEGQSVTQPFEPAWVVHHIRPIKRRTQNRRISYLATITAADARLINMRDWVVAQRIVQSLKGQRGTP